MLSCLWYDRLDFYYAGVLTYFHKNQQKLRWSAKSKIRKKFETHQRKKNSNYLTRKAHFVQHFDNIDEGSRSSQSRQSKRNFSEIEMLS